MRGGTVCLLVGHWQELQHSVMDGTYRPEAVRRVEIPKPNGGVRQLGIPTVIDRMLQQSMAQELDKHYDATFLATSEREVVHAPERENQENHWS